MAHAVLTGPTDNSEVLQLRLQTDRVCAGGPVEAVALEQPTKVGAIETGESCSPRDRAACALHHLYQITALERGSREALGLGERAVHQIGQDRGLFHVRSRGLLGGLLDDLVEAVGLLG